MGFLMKKNKIKKKFKNNKIKRKSANKSHGTCCVDYRRFFYTDLVKAVL